MTRAVVMVVTAVLLSAPATAQSGPTVITPEAARFLTILRGTTKVGEYRGRRAIELIPGPETAGKDTDILAILAADKFADGTIEAEIAGAPRPGASEGARGFVGIAFRTGERGEWSEIFYLRPTNGRSDDQLRRNHALQYVSEPEYPWHRLRNESPGVYESYADMEPGVWTKIRIVVSGATARLYLHGADQPALIVNDLKRGAGTGRVALWAHVETDARFGTITIRPAG